MGRIFQIEPSMDESEKQELLKVIDSGWFTDGPRTKEFEKLFAKFVGVKYAIAVTSGTSALFVGLKSKGIKNYDEVIVPDLTFVASPNSVELCGGKPVLIDIEEKSLNINQKILEKCITKKTKAIMPVDFNGRSTDMSELRENANKNNLFLIEDACHAIGSKYKQKHMGTLSDIGIFSFSTPKIITTGQGGMIITNNKEIFEKCEELKDFGREKGMKKNMKKSFEHNSVGYNFKFTEFQAAVGIAQMRKLPTWIKRKKEIYKIYRENLSKINHIKFIETNLKEETPWMIDILVSSQKLRDKIIYELEKVEIGTRIFYPPIHSLKPYKKNNNSFPISSKISRCGLWLPSSTSITDENINRVCKKIKELF